MMYPPNSYTKHRYHNLIIPPLFQLKFYLKLQYQTSTNLVQYYKMTKICYNQTKVK